MMNGLRIHCVAVVAAALGVASLAPATVIQYQPHDEQRGVIVGDASEFTDNLGLWSEAITDGSRFAEQTSLLGPQLVVAWNEVSGSGAASHMDVRFSVNNTVPFTLTASASAGGYVLFLRDLTLGSNLAIFTTFGEDEAQFTGELTAGHDFALLSTLIDPFNAAPTAFVAFSIHQGDEESLTLIPGPGAAGVLAMAGLVAGVRRRRA